MEKIKIVILAGGKGKRMQSEKPKVLAEVRGKHMIRHLLEEVQKVTDEKPIVVVGYKAELVKKELGDSVVYVEQKEQLGTGHAVLQARNACGNAEHILVLFGDQPFKRAHTLRNLINLHLNSWSIITFATTKLIDFNDWRKPCITFGKVLRQNGQILIRAYQDAVAEEKEIREVDASCYIFEANWLWKNLKNVTNDNTQKEYYLIDLLRIASEQGKKINAVEIDPHEALGANTREELEILNQLV